MVMNRLFLELLPDEVEEETERFASEVALLEAEKHCFEIHHLRRQMSEEDALLRDAQSRLSDAEPFLREAENYGGLNKITDKDS